MLIWFIFSIASAIIYLKVFAKNDIPTNPYERKLLIPLGINAGLIGVWGGITNWAGSADFLPFWIMSYGIPTLGLIQGMRIRNILPAGVICSGVGLAIIVTSCFFYFEGFTTITIMIILIAESFLFSSIGVIIARKSIK